MDEEQLSNLIRRWYDEGLLPPPSDCPPLTQLYELVLSIEAEGEVERTPADAERIQTHVNGCERCQHLLALIRREMEDTQVVGSLPPSDALSTAGSYSHSPRRLRWALPGLAAAACITLVMIYSWPSGQAPAGHDVETIVRAEASRLFDTDWGSAVRGEGGPGRGAESLPQGGGPAVPPFDKRTRAAIDEVRSCLGSLLLDMERGRVILEDAHRLVALPGAPHATQQLVRRLDQAKRAITAEIIHRHPSLAPDSEQRVRRALGVWLVERYGLAPASVGQSHADD